MDSWSQHPMPTVPSDERWPAPTIPPSAALDPRLDAGGASQTALPRQPKPLALTSVAAVHECLHCRYIGPTKTVQITQGSMILRNIMQEMESASSTGRAASSQNLPQHLVALPCPPCAPSPPPYAPPCALNPPPAAPGRGKRAHAAEAAAAKGVCRRWAGVGRWSSRRQAELRRQGRGREGGGKQGVDGWDFPGQYSWESSQGETLMPGPSTLPCP